MTPIMILAMTAWCALSPMRFHGVESARSAGAGVLVTAADVDAGVLGCNDVVGVAGVVCVADVDGVRADGVVDGFGKLEGKKVSPPRSGFGSILLG